MLRSRLPLVLLPCLFLAACDYHDFDSSDRFQSDFRYSYTLNPGGRLEVENFNGAIEISGWDQPTCEITGAKYASTAEARDRIKVEINQTPNMIYVRSVRPSESVMELHGNAGVRYVIHVPRKVELSRISSTNGSIHIDGIDGPAELKTTNGGVRVESLKGKLSVRTQNGPVTVENIGDTMSLHTSNSAIRAENVLAGIEAGTSNGSITVQFSEKAPASSTPLKFETTNGRIDITMPASPRSEVRAYTTNGGITLRLPPNTAAKLRMETTHGQVRSDFLVNGADAEERHGGRQSLEEVIGAGGPLIDLRSSNGSIRLLKM